MFKKDTVDWKEYKALPRVSQVDFPYSKGEPTNVMYFVELSNTRAMALDALQIGFERGDKYVIFTHGHAASTIGKTTARSQVRALMRSKEASPYIVREECIQQEEVFIAALRLKPVTADKGLRPGKADPMFEKETGSPD
jgi:hypothetical protein